MVDRSDKSRCRKNADWTGAIGRMIICPAGQKIYDEIVMEGETPQILSYATPESHVRRFRNVWLILPYTGGLLLGACLVAFIICCVPIYWISDFGKLAMLCLLAVATLVAAVCVLLMLVLLGWFSKNRSHARPPQWSFAAGFLSPAVGGHSLGLFALVCFMSSPSPSGYGFTLGFIIFLSALSVLAAPFAMLQGREATIRPAVSNARRWRWLIALVVALDIAAILAGRRISISIYEHNCRALEAWARSNFQQPGNRYYGAIALPTAYLMMSDAGTADIITLADGRVILLFDREEFDSLRMHQIVFISGPVKPSDRSKDAAGDMTLQFEGCPALTIIDEYDSQHFRIERPYLGG